MADKTIPNLLTSVESEMSLFGSEVNSTVCKGKKLKIKVKKKNALNISNGKLKSGSRTPNNFSFLNMSVQKQTLRANNRALAENLAKVRQELHQSNLENQRLSLQNQQNVIELNRLRRLVGLKDEEIEIELQSRMKQHKQEMLALLQDLTTSMVQSTTYITSMHDKCQIQSPPSTDSVTSRSASTEAANERPSTVSTSSRSASMEAAVVEKSSRKLMTLQCLPMVDDFATPPSADVSTKRVSTDLDMTVIAEQSMLDDDMCLYSSLALPSVQETLVESSPTASVALKPLSKLPMHVLQRSIGLSTSASVTCNEDTKIKSYNKTALMPQVGQAKDEQKSVEVEKIKCQSENGKKNIQDEEQLKIDEDINLENSDSHHLKDVSAFGFGGNFAAELVSGSPILNPDDKSHSKHLESLKSCKTSNCANDTIKDKTAKKETEVVLKLAQQVIGTKQENGHKKLNTSSDTKQKLLVTDNLSKSDSRLLSRKSKSPLNKTCKMVKEKCLSRQKPYLHISNVKSKSQENTKEADNSKSLATLRSPENLGQGEVYNAIKDPFKPTSSLVRNPSTTNEAQADDKQDNWKASAVININSLAFLNKIRESIDSKSLTSEPLPQPSFLDEPTTYFNTEMDFTAVIDSSKFAVPLNSCDNHSPKIVNIECNKTNKGTLQISDINHVKEINSKTVNDKIMEDVAVEVRTMKPGVFTFNVSRKDADGIRKPIPENISKTRSKKKKVLTPEKAEIKMGDDRDTFNFGNRTPTVPLEKLAKANTLDLCHLSVNVLKNDQKMIKDASNVEKMEHKHDENIYFVPMSKGSPQDRPTVQRVRSKSGNSSKSRKKDDDDDDDWLPGGKTKSKSRSQSCGRSRSKTEKSSNTEKEVKSNDGHCLETELNERHHIVTNDGKDVAEPGMPRKSVRARTRTKTNLDDFDNVGREVDTNEDKRSIDANKYSLKDHSNSVDDIGNKYLGLEIMNLKSKECIYNVPMAIGSPEHKHVARRTRSKSGTQSKSKNQTVDIDCDNVSPDGSTKSEVCSRARSRSRQSRDIVSVPKSVIMFGASRTVLHSDNEKKDSSEFVKELKVERNSRSKSLRRKDNQSTDIEMVEAGDSDIENNEHIELINTLKITHKSESPLNSESAVSGVHCSNGEHEKLFKVSLKPKDMVDPVLHSQLDFVNKRRGFSKLLITSDVNSDVSLNDLKDKSDKLDDSASICSGHLPEVKPLIDTDPNIIRKSLLTKRYTTSVREKKDIAVAKDKPSRDEERLSIYQKSHIPDLGETLPSEVAPSQPASVSKKDCTNPDGFAMLKKRLALLNSGNHDSEMLRKRHLTETSSTNAEDNTSDCEGGTDGKRFRRSRIGISYALKPLNVKLRQGDKLFDSPTSKAKTEQARLAIAKKTAVSRHIKDHEENVEPTVQA